MLGVVASVLAVVCKRMQQLATTLAYHDTFHDKTDESILLPCVHPPVVHLLWLKFHSVLQFQYPPLQLLELPDQERMGKQ